MQSGRISVFQTMKNLYLVLLSVSFQFTFSQNHSIKQILALQPSTVRDTVFRLLAPDSSQAEIPATLICGKQKGPTLTVIAGIHGTSYPAMQAIMKLRKEIIPENLKGNLILIPVANMESFYSRSPYIHPRDMKDLNRSFPGNASGTITEVIADFITTKIFDATDIFLELHGGGDHTAAFPFIGYCENAAFTEQTRMASRLCEISGFPAIVSFPYELASGQPAIYGFKQAMRLGIPSLTMHIGKTASGQKSHHMPAKASLLNILRDLSMYDHKKNAAAAAAKAKYSRQSYVLSPAQGFFRSSRKPGQKVLQNEEIGYITDCFGKNVTIITAPHSGTILSRIATPPVNKGEMLFFIGY